jgi:hypothetical protein
MEPPKKPPPLGNKASVATSTTIGLAAVVAAGVDTDDASSAVAAITATLYGIEKWKMTTFV